MNKTNLIVLFGGILFGFGLAYSGMTKPEIVISFLQLKDLGLIFVLGGAALVTAVAINVCSKISKKTTLWRTIQTQNQNLILDNNCRSNNIWSRLGNFWPMPRISHGKHWNRKLPNTNWNRCNVHWCLLERTFGLINC